MLIPNFLRKIALSILIVGALFTTILKVWTNEISEPLIKKELSPLGGRSLLMDVPCLEPLKLEIGKQNAFLASKRFLIKNGYSEKYFDLHFCPLSIQLEHENQYARVTYKTSFPPYVAWWQHHFPITPNTSKVDDSGKKFLVHEVQGKELAKILTPQELHEAMKKLIGKFEGQISVSFGQMPATVVNKQLVLYGTASNQNPKTTHCGDATQIGTINIESGEGTVTFSGVCGGVGTR